MQTDNINPTLTGAEILWPTLTGEGVATVFGYPSGAIHPILVRHEHSNAAHMPGYPRLNLADNETPESPQ